LRADLPATPGAVPPTPDLEGTVATRVQATLTSVAVAPTVSVAPTVATLAPSLVAAPKPTVAVSGQEIQVEQVLFTPLSSETYYTGAVLLKNPNQDLWIGYEDYTATAFDAAGTVVGTDKNVVSLAPGEERWMVIMQVTVSTRPARFDFQLRRTKPFHPATSYPPVKLSVVQSNLQAGQHTGLIKNDGSIDVSLVNVEIVYFDAQGGLLGTSSAFIQNLAAGQQQSFKASVYSKIQPTATKTYAIPELFPQFFT
jgi:hypothetical protein